MKKRYIASGLMALLTSGIMVSSASAISTFTIEFEPTTGDVVTLGTSATLALADYAYDSDGDGFQDAAIYGAGFMMSGSSYIEFNADLFTYDSYSKQQYDQSGNPTNTGWWDAFVVNLSQTNYYWNQTLSDPLVDPNYTGGTPITSTNPDGISWVWGGQDYGGSQSGGLAGLETFEMDVNEWISLSLAGADPNTPIYVSFVLDTLTSPDSDTSYESWGQFDVKVVPEPTTLLLFGAGLAGIAGMRRRRNK